MKRILLITIIISMVFLTACNVTEKHGYTTLNEDVYGSIRYMEKEDMGWSSVKCDLEKCCMSVYAGVGGDISDDELWCYKLYNLITNDNLINCEDECKNWFYVFNDKDSLSCGGMWVTDCFKYCYEHVDGLSGGK